MNFKILTVDDKIFKKYELERFYNVIERTGPIRKSTGLKPSVKAKIKQLV